MQPQGIEMKTTTLLAVALGVGALAACNKSPTEQAAENVESNYANVAENVEGRERYPINVRYAPDFRDDLEKLKGVVIATPSNAQVPLGELAKVSFSKGPTMIRDEDAALDRSFGGAGAGVLQSAARGGLPADRLGRPARHARLCRSSRPRPGGDGAVRDHAGG